MREEGSNPAMAPMVVSALLFLVAGVAWLSYVGHGMGDRYGVSGREQILERMRAHSGGSFYVAVCAEALAVFIASRGLVVTKAPEWLRLSVASVMAVCVTLLTYELVKGF